MNTSFSVQADFVTLLDNYRQKIHPGSTSREYRDGYILTEMINSVPLNTAGEKLLQYETADSAANKIVKSVTLTSPAHDKLKKLASSLEMSESKAVRLVAYYCATPHTDETSSNNQLPPQIDEAIVNLRAAIQAAQNALSILENSI